MKKLKLKQAVIVLLTMIGLLSGQVYAAQAQVESLQAQPVATFTEAEVNALFINALFDHNADQPMQLAVLSQQEMMETEGAVAPLVAIGVMTGTRFIAQRYVTQAVAQRMVQRGSVNVKAPNRSIAKNIAGRGGIREFHSGPGARFTHFHPASRNGSHIWYGSRR